MKQLRPRWSGAQNCPSEQGFRGCRSPVPAARALVRDPDAVGAPHPPLVRVWQKRDALEGLDSGGIRDCVVQPVSAAGASILGSVGALSRIGALDELDAISFASQSGTPPWSLVRVIVDRPSRAQPRPIQPAGALDE